MKSLISAALGAALSLLLVQPASAQWQAKAGAGVRAVSHTETDGSGRRLVRESGWLPGLALQADYTTGKFTWSGALDWYRGDIDYRGQTQAGVAAASRTATGLASLRFGAAYAIQNGYSATAAVEADTWKRDIRGSGNKVGLQERYRSERLIVGLSKAWQLPGAVAAADVAVLLATPERMRVGFSGVLDPVSLNTKRARGIRIGAQYRPAFAPSLELHASFDWIRIGRSEEAPVTRDGQFAGSVAQPEHVRQGLSVNVARLF
ncbi:MULTISPECIES: hypothetical protein [unclassified Massilia]|uniref:hypothetical protein n=1 Tax=unclassified Massilia TaxID=2609279 RepID=UPI0017805422|nr:MULTISPECIES: hypothetical protein [unclassified Massilia]MBD8531781.1 hypothetical protein [Massilia sp. CFBP 13647]MBD8675226.1 hypothetical protein [Massilia sp. CFBP 13721]